MCHIYYNNNSTITTTVTVLLLVCYTESPEVSDVHGVRINEERVYVCWDPVGVSSRYRLFTEKNGIEEETDINATHFDGLPIITNQTLYIQAEAEHDSSSSDYLPSKRANVLIKGKLYFILEILLTMQKLSEPAVILMDMINGVVQENNSIIDIREIDQIVCNTEKRPCCKGSVSGEWYYPNNSIVPIMGKGWNFYRSRDDEGNIILHLSAENDATGRYCCQAPDQHCDGLNHTLCFNLGTT